MPERVAIETCSENMLTFDDPNLKDSPAFRTKKKDKRVSPWDASTRKSQGAQNNISVSTFHSAFNPRCPWYARLGTHPYPPFHSPTRRLVRKMVSLNTIVSLEARCRTAKPFL